MNGIHDCGEGGRDGNPPHLLALSSHHTHDSWQAVIDKEQRWLVRVVTIFQASGSYEYSGPSCIILLQGFMIRYAASFFDGRWRKDRIGWVGVDGHVVGVSANS